MKFSVAMAVYNGEKYLPEQIDSIICQLDAEDELIISYDNSEDNTLEIITRYAANDHRIKIVKNENPGLFNNFQNAINNCNNEIIFISDQDDIWSNEKCKVVLNHFELEEVDMIIHNGIHFNNNTKNVSDDFFKLYGISDNLLKNFIMPRYSGCCMAFKREIVPILLPIPHTIGGYDHWIGMVGQTYFKTLFLNEELILHRLHDNNFTPVSRRPLFEILNVRFHLLFNLLKRRNMVLKLKKGNLND